MKLFAFLRKPAWQHADPETRARGVAESSEAALLAALPGLARSDEDPRVRMAALRRLDDLALLGDRMRHDGDAAVRALARERFASALADARVPPAERERLLRVEDDPDILAGLAVGAPEPALRELALERLARPGLLVERCLRDPDPALRQRLLARIEDPAALERIAESARRTDKQLARAAREKLDRARLAAGDPEALRQRALALCEEIDAARRARGADLRDRRDAFRAEWATLAPRVPAELQRRVAGHFELLDAVLDGPAARAAIAAPASPVGLLSDPGEAAAQAPLSQTGATAAPEPAVEADDVTGAEPDAAGSAPSANPSSVPPADASPLAAFTARLDALAGSDDLAGLEALAAALAAHRAEAGDDDARLRDLERRLAGVRRAAQRRFEAAADGARADAVRAALPAVLAALDGGRLADARRAFAAVRDALGDAEPPAAVRAAHDEAQSRLEQLARWQHWSNDVQRKRLCDAIEALAGAGLHPDALAARVKEAQTEWQQLDDSEGLDSARAAETGLARRFRALCHRALAPARPYFEKRHALRGERREALVGELAAIEAVLAQSAEDADPRPLRQRVVAALRELDGVEPRARADLGRRLRAALGALDARAATRREAAEAGKRKLLANLRRELQRAEADDAVNRAKSAMAEWKTLPRTDRGTEDALWAELRALVDPWFARIDEARAEQERARNATAAERAAILAEMEALTTADAATLRHAEARITSAQARWRALVDAPAEEDDRDGGRGRGRGDGRDGERARGEVRRERPSRARPAREDALDAAIARVRDAQRRAERDRRAVERDALFAEARRCAEAEERALAGEPVDTVELADPALLSPSLREALGVRLTRARAAAADAEARRALAAGLDAAAATAAELAVRAEFLAGVETPEPWRAERRAYQVQRLAERLSGGDVRGSDNERRAIELAWAGLGPLPRDVRIAVEARLATAFAALGES